MSYILEALKKSESERASQSAPTVTTLQNVEPDPHAGHNWLLWLVPLNVLLLALVGWMLLRPAAPVTPAVATAQAPPAVAAARASGLSEVAALPVARPAVPAPRAAYPFASATRSEAAPARQAPGGSPATPRATATAAAAQRAPTVDESLLDEPLRTRVASLEFSTHIYADEINMRAVSIDGERLGQGQRSRDGIQVVEITPNGAVLLLDGQRVNVDVMARWQF